MVALRKDPKGEKIFTTIGGCHNGTVGKQQVGGAQSGGNNDDKIVICALEKRVKELEFQLVEQKVNVTIAMY